MEPQTDETIDTKIKNAMSRFMSTLTLNEMKLKLYEWDSVGLYSDWRSFFKSVKSVEIDSLDTFMYYFYDKFTNVEVNEGAEFL